MDTHFKMFSSELGLRQPAAWYTLVCLFVLILTEVSSVCVTAQEAGRRWAPTSIGQLDVSQHLMCRLRSEFATTHRPPTCLIVRLDMLVLQATAQPRVFLYTLYFLFFDTLLLRLIVCILHRWKLFFGFGFRGFLELKNILDIHATIIFSTVMSKCCFVRSDDKRQTIID